MTERIWDGSVLACEAAGLLGTHIFSLGCDVILSYYRDEEIVTQEATDLLEFRECLMRMTRSQVAKKEYTSEILYASDICISGFRELEDALVATEIARKPSVLIQELTFYPR